MTRLAGNFFSLLLLLNLVLISCCAFAEADSGQTTSADDADVVWIESDGIRHEVFFATLQDGAWSSPVQVTDDSFDNLHPVIDRDSQGKRWLFWTASDNGKLSLHYATYTNSEWSEIQVVPAELYSSIAPSVIIDKHNVLWLVWAGNTGNPDDIYWATLEDGNWSSAAALHEKDEVPDILPTISLTATGTPRVVWKKFIDGRYRDVESTWDGEKWSAPERVEEGDAGDSALDEQEIVLPEFIKDDDKAFVRIY